MSQLLLFSLGPIQDFISSARRCQDLWFGSWLLSELSRATAAAVADAVGSRGSVIFPATHDGDRERPGIANKILVRVADDLSPAEVAEEARAAQQARLYEIAQVAWARVPSEPFHRETAERQLAELMEFLWVAVPERGDYAAARTEAERRLASVKNTRLWAQPSWAPPSGVPKSSLDGERESVVDESVYDWTAERRRRAFGLKGRERLCGIGLLKRLGSDPGTDERIFRGGRPPFHSTSHIAMIPLLERIASHPSGEGAARDYLDTLGALGLDLGRFRLRAGARVTLLGHDGVLLLESRLRDHLEESGQSDPSALSQATSALRELLRAVDVREPCPYYAFLLADGDRMGKAIDALGTLEHHRALGEALDRFSLGCRAIVERHQGSLIFSGGDDVLALLPLHRALACARELAERFEAVQTRLKQLRPVDDDLRVSLSVGLAISHCREPMGEARHLAKQAESVAKGPRNALAIWVAKRSGGELVLSGRWDEERPVDTRLEEWLCVLSRGGLSAKTAYELEQLATHYDGLGTERLDEVRSLTAQILQRKRERGGGADADDTLVRPLIERIHSRSSLSEQLRAMSAELQVASLLLRAQRNATGEGDDSADTSAERGTP